MNLLVLDTATPRAVVALMTSKIIDQRSGSERVRADDLLSLIDEMLGANQLRLTDLGAIIVRRGVGSYTGLRVGVTIANSLAWALAIPLVGFTTREPTPINQSYLLRSRARFVTRATQSATRKRLSWLVPRYGRWQQPAGSATIQSDS